jgi:hypothetical protein
MARDARLAGHGSNYFSGNEPQRYIDFTKDVFERKSKVDYATLFTIPADSFETPFSPGVSMRLISEKVFQHENRS